MGSKLALLVACNGCGWISSAWTKEQAKKHFSEVNAYYASLPADHPDHGRSMSLDDFTCDRCKGSYFRKAEDGEMPVDAAASPVVVSDAFYRELRDQYKRELLASFSRGEISKSTVMARLDISYFEVLDLLEEFKLPLPRVSKEVAAQIAKTMNDILDGKN